MLSIKSYIKSDKLLNQVGELRPGFLDKDTSFVKGTSPDNSLSISVYESIEESNTVDFFKLVETTHQETGEKMFVIE